MNDHVLDPEGDLVLVLHYLPDDLTDLSSARGETPVSETPLDLAHTNDSESVKSDHSQWVEACVNDESSKPLEETEPISIRVKVSSKHLTLASQSFKTMLERAVPLPDFGLGRSSVLPSKQVELDDNFEALLILLNILYGKFRKVPTKIQFSLLVEVSELVHKYELQEQVSMFSEMWHMNLDTKPSVSYDELLLPWMFVSWVFGWDDIWENVTRIATLESDRLICTDLPIPDFALNLIDKRRRNIVSRIFGVLGDTETGFRLEPRCKLHCDALRLGAITIIKEKLRIPPTLDHDMAGFSVNTVQNVLQELSFEEGCQKYSTKPRRRKCEGLQFITALKDNILEMKEDTSGVPMDRMLPYIKYKHDDQSTKAIVGTEREEKVDLE